jgi:two-component system sensor histidine kinase DegS
MSDETTRPDRGPDGGPERERYLPSSPPEPRAYTPGQMETARAATDPRESRFDGLHADAKAAVGYAANSLRIVRERYRAAYLDELGRWHAVRDELDRLERRDGAWGRQPAPTDATDPAAAAEAGADDARLRTTRSEVERLTTELGLHQQELGKLELAQQNLERTWLFLERGDSSLLSDPADPELSTDLRMRIVEAQEAERSRLAQEVHDGPAQSLTNAIFQVEYIERVFDQDGRLARTELRFLRELLRRELGDVRSFISQLRPPLLEHLGLDGSIRDTVDNLAALTGLPIDVELAAPADRLDETAQTVVLRVVQEALQNVRKHAAATGARVTTRLDDETWLLEVQDDGRGFDPTAVAVHGRRSFGLQFMRERADLIGARFEVRSRPDGGTVVRLAIPLGGERNR